MDDRKLTEALAGLGLDRRNHAAVALLPLIEVAWADGRIQRAERQLIGAIAARYGLDPGDDWLKRWLHRKPSPTTFLAARTVLLALMSRAGKAGPRSPESLEGLLDLCVEVAEAAGGLFGIAFTFERSERECIEEIATSLALGPALPDVVVRAWQTSERRALSEQPTTIRKKPQKQRSVPSVPTEIRTAPNRKQRTPTPAPRFDEDDPTVPYFDELRGGLASTYVIDDEDEDDEGG